MGVSIMAQWPVEGEKWPEIGEPTLDVTATSAGVLLRAMGLDPGEECVGEARPGEFLARVFAARQTVADHGSATHRPGWFADRWDLLAEIARLAVTHHGKIVWA